VSVEFDPSLPAINETEVEHYCFGCGRQNPHGLLLRFRRCAAGIWADFTPARAHEGYLGGILATIADETMSWAVTDTGDIGVTARMSLTFRRPARVGEPLRALGQVSERRSRAIDAEARIFTIDGNHVVAEATARFIRVSPEQAREWRDAYGAAGDTRQSAAG
jgi:acyl-coenzyme A thioesterase PaaI-like protein